MNTYFFCNLLVGYVFVKRLKKLTRTTLLFVVLTTQDISEHNEKIYPVLKKNIYKMAAVAFTAENVEQAVLQFYQSISTQVNRGRKEIRFL